MADFKKLGNLYRMVMDYNQYHDRRNGRFVSRFQRIWAEVSTDPGYVGDSAIEAELHDKVNGDLKEDEEGAFVVSWWIKTKPDSRGYADIATGYVVGVVVPVGNDYFETQYQQREGTFKVQVINKDKVPKDKLYSVAAGDEMDAVMRMMAGDFNPNHDPNDGRFTEGSGGSSGSESSKGDRLGLKALKEAKVGTRIVTGTGKTYEKTDDPDTPWHNIEDRYGDKVSSTYLAQYKEPGGAYSTKGSNKVDVSKGFPKTVKYDGEEYYKGQEMTGGAWSYVRWDDGNNEQYITVNGKGEIERN